MVPLRLLGVLRLKPDQQAGRIDWARGDDLTPSRVLSIERDGLQDDRCKHERWVTETW